jgi:hypothetical protein
MITRIFVCWAYRRQWWRLATRIVTESCIHSYYVFRGLNCCPGPSCISFCRDNQTGKHALRYSVNVLSELPFYVQSKFLCEESRNATEHGNSPGCFHCAVLRMIRIVGLLFLTGTRLGDKNYSLCTKEEIVVIEKCFKFKPKLNIRRQCFTFSISEVWSAYKTFCTDYV